MERLLQASNYHNSSRRGEGVSEVQGWGDRDLNRLFYIQYLKDNSKLNFDIRPFNGTVKKGWKIESGMVCMCGDGFSVENYNDLKNSMDCEMRPKVICIFDLDKCIENATIFKKYKELLQEKLNDKRKFDYYFCTSLPSIEYWFLLHYPQFNDKTFYKKIKSCNSIATEISKDKNITFLKSAKAKEWFDMLCEDEYLNRAKERAEAKANHSNRLDKVSNPSDCDISYSDLYKLFEIK